ncbi:MAG TPA: hypothetical protein PLY85_10855 [Anaerolineaceae bacterium]|nr:hypothetical protein [Anaerolineaceae bacterium]HQP09507.1 hypothetical protein [Anaerolineaceae bacterium]
MAARILVLVFAGLIFVLLIPFLLLGTLPGLGANWASRRFISGWPIS